MHAGMHGMQLASPLSCRHAGHETRCCSELVRAMTLGCMLQQTRESYDAQPHACARADFHARAGQPAEQGSCMRARRSARRRRTRKLSQLHACARADLHARAGQLAEQGDGGEGDQHDAGRARRPRRPRHARRPHVRVPLPSWPLHLCAYGYRTCAAAGAKLFECLAWSVGSS